MSIVHYNPSTTRKTRRVRYEIPESLDLDQLCVGYRMETKRNIAHFLHYLIYRMRWYPAKWRGEFYATNSKLMEQQLGGTGWYNCRRLLLSHCVVETNGKWLASEISQGYKLSPMYCGATKVVEFPAKGTRKAPQKPQKSIPGATPPKSGRPIDAQLMKDLALIEVDPTYASIQDIAPQDYNILSKIEATEHTITYGMECGRLFHTYSNLDRTYMNLLSVGQQPIRTIDLKTCYPTIILNWMNGITIQGRGSGRQASICALTNAVPYWEREFWLWLVEGDLYQWFADQLGTLRDRVKTYLSAFLCADILDPAFRFNRLKPIFERALPYVLEGLTKVKQQFHLANELMREESALMLGHVVPAIQAAGYWVVPNHDAVFVRECDVGSVYEIVARVVKQLGIFAVFDAK